MSYSSFSKGEMLEVWLMFLKKTVCMFPGKGRTWSERKWEVTPRVHSGPYPKLPMQPSRDFTFLLNSTLKKNVDVVFEPPKFISFSQPRERVIYFRQLIQRSPRDCEPWEQHSRKRTRPLETAKCGITSWNSTARHQGVWQGRKNFARGKSRQVMNIQVW